jgi:very-short-patch-repair endonuclease
VGLINKRTEIELNNSNSRVSSYCDCCGLISTNVLWHNYIRYVHEDGKYYCRTCGYNLFSNKKQIKTFIENGQSFYDWCIENDRLDILNRWDSELNKCSPNEVTPHGDSKYWFKCPRGIHSSELKLIKTVTDNNHNTMKCKKCNSIGQYIIDTYGVDSLNYYWDWYNNTKEDGSLIDPFSVAKGSRKSVYIYCQKHSYHGSYLISAYNFIYGKRCPRCIGKTGKVHSFDSFGQYIINNYGKEFLQEIWSNRNIKSSFEYSSHSTQKVMFKCLENKHNDYSRSIQGSIVAEFRCPECQFTKGEKRIENYLNVNNFVKDEDYTPQKEFDGLLGVGNRNLSYDFYLCNYNLLIEYQGEFHDGTAQQQTEKQFKIQQEHDKRKKQYAIDNNIKLLPIWYSDFNDIENILNKELNINKEG